MVRRFAVAWICIGAAAGAMLAQTPQPAASSKSGVELSAIDRSADPCNNFYQFACGGWIQHNPVPPDQASWNRFAELTERNRDTLRGILEDAEKHEDRSALDQKIGGFYQACMDEPRIEQLGPKPLQPELDRIAQVETHDQLVAEAALLHEQGIGVFFTFDAPPDPNNAEMTIAEVDQGGLGLPERDYYLRTDEKSVELRKEYVRHLAKTFQLLGVPADEAAHKADAVMAIETDLAKASLDVTARRDPRVLVHEMSKADFDKLAPAFNFDQFFVAEKAPQFATLKIGRASGRERV